MTHSDHIARSVVAPGLAIYSGRDIALAIGAAISAIFNRYKYGQELARFDQRMLADIGLTPGDVSSAFAEPLWRDPTLRLSVIATERRSAARARNGRVQAQAVKAAK